jgi:hypothetical protein
MYAEGVPHCICTETPGSAPLEQRVRVTRKIIDLTIHWFGTQEYLPA